MMKNYDSFLSYAGEDKEFASEIVGALKSKGIKIWYAPIDLCVGEKLLDSIEKGISQSNSGIMLISSAYLNKGWTNYEMDTLIRQNIEGNKSIFPIWHNVEKNDVAHRHSGLGGIVAINTNIGMPELVSKLTAALSKFAPSIGVIPNYESPAWRFLQGNGEIILGTGGPAATLWEFLLHSNDDAYPLFLDGKLYTKEDLLLSASQLLPHIPYTVDNWVREDGRKKIWDMCVKANIDPKQFE